jgi:uncharacterized protein with GYD domain
MSVVGELTGRVLGRKQEAAYMPHYVLLVNWTDQGIRNVRETLHRADEDVLGQLEQEYGTRIEHIYWTVGPHDLITIVEAPDDESVSAMVLALGSLVTSGSRRFAPTTAKRCPTSSRGSGLYQAAEMAR